MRDILIRAGALLKRQRERLGSAAPTRHRLLAQAPRRDATPDQVCTPAIESVPPIDADLFDEIWDSMHRQPASMHRIRDAFLKTARGLLPLLKDWQDPAIRSELHTLVGSAGMIGAKRIEHIALQLQAAIREGRRERLDDMKRLLERSIEDFERAFDERLAATRRS